MSPSRMVSMLARLAVLSAVAAGAWLGFQHLSADGLSSIDAAVVGLATFVLATVIAFSRA